jgi:hypothetical protein
MVTIQEYDRLIDAAHEMLDALQAAYPYVAAFTHEQPVALAQKILDLIQTVTQEPQQ